MSENKNSSLADEIRADQDPRVQCRFCTWLSGLDPKARAEWVPVTEDRSFTKASIFRVAQRHGYMAGRSSVESHISGQHKVLQ